MLIWIDNRWIDNSHIRDCFGQSMRQNMLKVTDFTGLSLTPELPES